MDGPTFRPLPPLLFLTNLTLAIARELPIDKHDDEVTCKSC